ncbi:MAG: T9SS type A sorting domain-containing protein [Bacteroidales bacterium]|nr:T9SS type A sorting domain-containing protein [Bacteroidales bacterium]
MKNLQRLFAATCLIMFLSLSISVKAQIPCEPVNQQATEITAHTAVLSWEGLTGYTKVRYYPSGTADYKIRGAHLNNTVTLGFLLADTDYTWEISTFCDGVWTEYGWPQTFTTLEDNVVCEPINQQATEITAHTAVLNWEGLTGYTKVRYYPSGTTDYKIRGAQLNNTVTLGFLLADTDYTWEISTFCNGAWTAYGWPQTFTTLEDTVVCEPINQQATEITAHTAVLSWEGLTGYTKVRYYPTGTTNYKFRGAHLNNTVTLGFLAAETEYTWEISTFCNGAWTAYGWPQTFTTLVSTQVCEPTNQVATEITSTGATLSWESLTVPAKVRFYPSGTTEYKIKGAFLNNTVTLTCLLPETDYTWELSVFCNGIWTEFGWPESFTTLAAGAMPGNESMIKTLVMENEFIDILESTAYPNPFNNHTNLIFNSFEGTIISLKVINLLGEVVYEMNDVASEGQNSILLDLSNVNSGVYFAILQTGDSLNKIKLIKK